MLAAANAVTDADLVAGTTLRAPQVTTTANDASTFKPYDPNAILGPTTPSLPYIAPPPKQQCNAVAQILMAVVAIVVTVYTAGVASFAMSGLTAAATTGQAIAAAVIGGAVGAATSTALGSAMGVASFSWRNVAAQGLAAGLTAGFGAWANASTRTLAKLVNTSNATRAAAGAVVGNLAGYAANRLVGNDVHFSWTSVAASAVSGAISAKVVPTLIDKLNINRLTENGQTKIDLLGGMVGGVVSASVRKVFVGGDVDYGQVALDAFGNMLGNRMSGQHAHQAGLYMSPGDSQAAGASFQWDYTTATASIDGGGYRGQQIPSSDLAAWDVAGQVKTLDTVEVIGTRENPTSGGAWMWNSQADKWLNMETGQLHAPSTRQQEVVQGWSPVPKVVTTNGGGYSLVDFFGGPGNFAKATASTWGIDRATRDLRSFQPSYAPSAQPHLTRQVMSAVPGAGQSRYASSDQEFRAARMYEQSLASAQFNRGLGDITGLFTGRNGFDGQPLSASGRYDAIVNVATTLFPFGKVEDFAFGRLGRVARTATSAPGVAGRAWTPVEVGGRRVYQNDALFDPFRADVKGRTNIERMAQGLSPIGKDGRAVELHHLLQQEMSRGAPAPLAEITSTLHSTKYDVLHLYPRNSAEYTSWRKLYPDQAAQYDAFRRNYWMQRSEGFSP